MIHNNKIAPAPMVVRAALHNLTGCDGKGGNLTVVCPTADTDIKTAALLVIPCAVVALGILVGATLLRRASFVRETALVKAAIAERREKTAPAAHGSETDPKPFSKPLVLWGLRGVILAVGIVLIVLGILNGGMADVLGKAIRICTECIGLG